MTAVLTGMTQAEMVERIEELEAFKTDWEPVLIQFLQSLKAMSNDPMFKAMSGMMPPQVQSLMRELDKR